MPLHSFSLFGLQADAVCDAGVLYNRCGTQTSGGGALVRMSTEMYGDVRRHAPQKTACFPQPTNTPQFSESERGGALVRMGTDKYGNVRRHAPQKTACFTQSPNTPLFFESERGFGGKRKPSFLVKRKFSLSSKLSPFTLIELLVVIAIIAILAAGTIPDMCSTKKT